MHKRYKDQQGKAVKWINTRYAKPFILRAAVKRACLLPVIAAGIGQLNVIRSIRASTAMDRAKKAIAIARVISGVSKAVAEYDEKK